MSDKHSSTVAAHHDSHEHHVVPLKYYVGTLIALIILTVITVVVAQFHFGSFNLLVAMIVAIIKASLVLLFFMGLRWESKYNVVIFLSTLLFFGIFVGFTVVDFGTRAQRDPIDGKLSKFNSPVKIVAPKELKGH